MSASRPTAVRNRGITAAVDLRRVVRLFRRFMGSRTQYSWGVVLLAVEAVSAVVEPYPIAYLIDYLQGAKPGLRSLGLPAILSSPRMETILVLTGVTRSEDVERYPYRPNHVLASVAAITIPT